MRLVSQEVNNAIEVNKNAPANFGLAFNKWLIFEGCEPIVKRNKQPLIDSYGKSSKQTEKLLQQRHLQQAQYCRSMEQAGWRSFIIHAQLTSSFVSGLGMTHPTETGMVLDHTSGMPYIPAASQKGALRMAHIINSLLEDDTGNWKELETLLAQGIVKEEPMKDSKKMELCWQEDDTSKTLFGFSGKKNSLAGQLIVLDAYPLAPPTLGEEILNPHFGDYYKGNRGPTEDQSPIPVKFMVVKSGADFVFRLLLRRSLESALEKDQEKLTELIEKNLPRAICEEGMGAKTALGFGRFAVITKGEPEKVQGWLRRQQEDEEQKKYPWRPTVRKFESVNDWGQLKQLLDNKDIQTYQAQAEVGLSVKDAATRIRIANPKKWEEERDKLVTEWLKTSGIVWESRVAAATSTPSQLSPEDQAAVEKIIAITVWSGDLLTRLNAEALPLTALLILQKRMKQEWGCENKKAEKKRKEWEKLKAILRAKQHV